MTNTAKQSGFQTMLAQRKSMQTWSHVRILLNQGSNREAEAIVESFQKQMHFEESECCALAA